LTSRDSLGVVFVSIGLSGLDTCLNRSCRSEMAIDGWDFPFVQFPGIKKPDKLNAKFAGSILFTY